MSSPDQSVMGTSFSRVIKSLSLSQELQAQLLYSGIAILVIILIRFIVLRIVFRTSKNTARRFYWRKVTTYVAFGLAVALVGRVWFAGFHSLMTFFGLLSAGLAIALKDPLMNLAGWAFIIWRAPFSVGDRIQVGDQKGDVIDLRILEFTLAEIDNWAGGDMATGRVIYVPNGVIFTKPVANYSKGGFPFIWHEIPVLITFESDWKKAKKLLEEIAARHGELFIEAAEKEERTAAEKLFIQSSDMTPKVYTTVKDSGVLLTLRYLCEPPSRREAEEAAWEDILNAFARHRDIEFAYPTRRFYDNLMEGKEASKSSSGIPPKSNNRSM